MTTLPRHEEPLLQVMGSRDGVTLAINEQPYWLQRSTALRLSELLVKASEGVGALVVDGAGTLWRSAHDKRSFQAVNAAGWVVQHLTRRQVLALRHLPVGARLVLGPEWYSAIGESEGVRFLGEPCDAVWCTFTFLDQLLAL